MRSLQIRDHFVSKTVIWMNKDVPGYGPWAPLLWGLGVEPTVGFENLRHGDSLTFTLRARLYEV